MKKFDTIGKCNHCGKWIYRNQKYKIIKTIFEDKHHMRKEILVHKTCFEYAIKIHLDLAYNEINEIKSILSGFICQLSKK